MKTFNEMSSLLCHKRHNKHFLERYLRIIEIAKTRILDVGERYERHHVLPSSMFRRYKNLNRNKWNEVLLTPREHFVVHMILAKAYGGKMASAFLYMSKIERYNNRKINSRIYDSIKKEQLEYKKQCLLMNNGYTQRYVHESETEKYISNGWVIGMREDLCVKRSGTNNPFYGKHHTEETRALLRRLRSGENNFFYGKKRPDHSERMKIIMKDRIITEEHKRNISLSHNKTYTCPHCGKSGGRLLLRWHFDHCFMVNERVNLFECITPNGTRLLFSSVLMFAEEHQLSTKVITNKLKKQEVNKNKATVIGENYHKTQQYEFNVLRLVKPIK